ncbi:MAG TPA: XrtA-associated tyrosine autokinase [Ideonella sp.]|nr:XrtA-associated tyrosine autokinase [Ideonella sp.]
MNLIQQAEKRLAELKRAGELREVRVSNGVSTLEPVHHGHGAVSHLAAHAQARRSARVELDLAQLERRGYLVPSIAESRIAEDFRQLKRALMSNITRPTASPQRHEALVMVTSALPGEGKTFCSINLAMSIAMGMDTSVLLVDADVLNPSVLSRLSLRPARGLLDVLTEPNLDLADLLLATNVPKLSILPAGTPSPKASELMASTALDHLLAEIASRYPDRLVVFDAPPLLLTTVGPALAQRLGQIVMVVEAAKTSRESVAQAFAAVESCPIVLSVLNNCSPRMAARGYGYGYGALAAHPPEP